MLSIRAFGKNFWWEWDLYGIQGVRSGRGGGVCGDGFACFLWCWRSNYATHIFALLLGALGFDGVS